MPVQLRRSYTTRDDRNQPVGLRTLDDPLGGVPAGDSRMRPLRARVRGILGVASGGTALAFFIVAILVTTALISWNGFQDADSDTAMRLISFAIPGVMTALVVRSRIRMLLPRITTEYLRDGVCPGCGYNLFALSPCSEGLVTCPECGAAWAAARIHHAEPFDETAVGASGLLRPNTIFPSTLGPLGRRYACDDRDAPAALISVGDLQSIAAHDGAKAVRARTVADRLKSSGALFRRLLTIVLAALGVMSATTTLMLAVVNPALPITAPIVCALGTAFLFWSARAVHRSELGRSAALVVSTVRSAGLCAACGHDLLAITPAPDGCTVCPDCAAAWRLDIPTPRRPLNDPS